MKNITMNRRHEDDEYIDQIVVDLVPRFKTSGLSGDEWRVSSRVRFMRKGFEVWSRGFTSMQVAVAALPWFFRVASEGSDGDFKILGEDQASPVDNQDVSPSATVVIDLGEVDHNE